MPPLRSGTTVATGCPLVTARLQAREPDDFFTGLVDDLSDQDWLRIGTDMSLPPAADTLTRQ